MLKTLTFCAVFVCFLGCALGDSQSILSKYTNCVVYGRSTKLSFAWTLNSTSLMGALSVPNVGYVSIGFNTQSNMLSSDFLVFTRNPSNGKVTMWDYWSNLRDVCKDSSGTCLDTKFGGQNNGDLINSEFFNNIFTVEFVRSRVPVDRFDSWINSTTTWTLFAYGDYPQLQNGEPLLEKHNAPSPFAQLLPLGNSFGLGACIPSAGTTSSPTSTPGIINWSLYNFTYNIRSFFKFGWRLPTNSSVEFALEFASPGWFGFGFSRDGSGNMVPGEAYACNNGETAGRYYLESKEDAQQQNLLPDSDYLSSNGVTQLKFTREFAGILTKGVIDPTKFVAIYAFSTSSFAISEHSGGDASGLTINLLTGEVQDISNSKLINAHGWLMWVSWAVLVPLAAAIARFMKKIMGEWWFRLHIALMVIAMTCVIASFGIIVNESKEHFDTPHARLGLAIFIIAMLQPIIGIIADRMFDPNRESVPIFPDMVHWVLGWSALILGFVNIWLGIDLWDSPKAIWILWGIHFAILVLGLAVWATVFQVSSAK